MKALSRRTLLQALAGPMVLAGAHRAQAGAASAGAPPGTGTIGAQPGEGTVGQPVLRNPPRPLSPDAVTHDWASFLGPTHNAVSTETRLSRSLPPPLVWEMEKGTGYTSPAIAGDRLVFLHRLGDNEVVECRHPETGGLHWDFRYPTRYRDRYGYNDGPRSSPVIAAGRYSPSGPRAGCTPSTSPPGAASGAATCGPTTGCTRTSSAPRRRRWSRTAGSS